MKQAFTRFAEAAAVWTGTVQTFGAYLLVIAVWLASGPLMHWNTTWQLVINTPTTVVTVGQLILVSHTQHRDNLALHAKLDTGVEHATAQDVPQDVVPHSPHERGRYRIRGERSDVGGAASGQPDHLAPVVGPQLDLPCGHVDDHVLVEVADRHEQPAGRPHATSAFAISAPTSTLLRYTSTLTFLLTPSVALVM